jgi:hypothetical protein
MFDSTQSLYETEMQVVNLHSDDEFLSRPVRSRETGVEVSAMRRLAHVFAQNPETILQELTEVSIDVCGAESAGITLEETTPRGDTQFRWIATAGMYGDFLGAVLPRFYSPCGTCLDRGQPQLFRVPKVYLDTIGVAAPPVTDGILIPWQVGSTRGTIWVLAHGPYQKFDAEDYRMIRSLSDFAAIAVRHRQQQDTAFKQATAASAAIMANQLAHQINNPLQGLTNAIFLAGQGGDGTEVYLRHANEDLARLSELVKKLLSLPNLPNWPD